MATSTRNRGNAQQPKTNGHGHNRIKDFLRQEEQLIESGQVQVTEATSEEGTAEEILAKAKSFIQEREQQRRIKLHERSPDEFQPAKKSEAKVLTTRSKRPDMRIAAHRNMYQADPGLRKDGRTPDTRFLEHRPDLLAYHLSQENSDAGVVFEDD